MTTPFNKKPGAPRVPPVFRPQARALPLQARSALPGQVIQRMQAAAKPFPPTVGRPKMDFDELRKKVVYGFEGSEQAWALILGQCSSMEELKARVADRGNARLAAVEREAAEKKADSVARVREEAERQKKEKEERAAALKLEAEAAEKRERERIARIEAGQQPKSRRRLESLARLLESPANVCVAVVEVRGALYAATNEGALAPLQFQAGALLVHRLQESTGINGERTRLRDAGKLSTFLEEMGEGAENFVKVKQVEAELGSQVHAEMKILNFLDKIKAKGEVQVYVSKLCCRKCEVAIAHWNAGANGFSLIAPGCHGNHFVGWEFPPCFNDKQQLRSAVIDALMLLPSDKAKKNFRGREHIPNTLHSQRERSLSPPPVGRKLDEYPGK